MLPVPVRLPGDKLGMLNHTTDATRAAALRGVRSRRLYDLGRVLGGTCRIPWASVPADTGHHRPPNDALMPSLHRGAP